MKLNNHPPFIWLLMLLIPIYFLVVDWERYDASQPKAQATPYQFVIIDNPSEQCTQSLVGVEITLRCSDASEPTSNPSPVPYAGEMGQP